MFKVEEICRAQRDHHILKIACYDQKEKNMRDLAASAPEEAVGKFIKTWKRSEEHKTCRFTIEEISDLNLGSLVKYLPIPHLAAILDSQVTVNKIKKTEEKYHLVKE